MKVLCHKQSSGHSNRALCGLDIGVGTGEIWRVYSHAVLEDAWEKDGLKAQGIKMCPTCLELEPLDMLKEQEL